MAEFRTEEGRSAEFRDATEARSKPWTCTKCGDGCDLQLEPVPVLKFLSACCTAAVRPTRTRDADTP